MMLAEEYALEAKRLITDPQIEITREQACHIASIRFHGWTTQLGQEFK